MDGSRWRLTSGRPLVLAFGLASPGGRCSSSSETDGDDATGEPLDLLFFFCFVVVPLRGIRKTDEWRNSGRHRNGLYGFQNCIAFF